ncbi:MAG: SRPBCC family protein [Chitinophagaceae bacterium]|nr:SRPBCC family protein [Chitinophagaceae bacterium]
METKNVTVVTVESLVNAPIDKVWECWTNPDHITKWNNASEDWHTPRAENDLRVGGKFSSRMEAKDGSMGFDFGGIYDEVRQNEYIEYTLGDDRKVKVFFTVQGDTTKVVEKFDAESTNSVEMQKGGWQAILDSFKSYVENHGKQQKPS